MPPKQRFLNRISRMIGGIRNLGASKITYDRKTDFLDKYTIPPVISDKYKDLFITQAIKAGVTPDEFGTIARREQGPLTTPEDIALVGGLDPEDRGVMQVNKVHEPLVKRLFKTELGRSYDPNKTADSIIAAGMVLTEHRRQFEQMKLNNTIKEYTSTDLIDSYNLGPTGVFQAKRGDPEKVIKLQRYQRAGIY